MILASASTTDYPKSFYTMPSVLENFGEARNASGSYLMAYVPVIQPQDLELWANYTLAHENWLADKQQNMDLLSPRIWEHTGGENTAENTCLSATTTSARPLAHPGRDRTAVSSADGGAFAPIWTSSPPAKASLINRNLLANPDFAQSLKDVARARAPKILDVCNLPSWYGMSVDEFVDDVTMARPVFTNFSDSATIVGYMINVVPWTYFVENILDEFHAALRVVLRSSCGNVLTLQVQGRNATVVASSQDLHDAQFNHWEVTGPFAAFANSEKDAEQGNLCTYTLSVYPTPAMQDNFMSRRPMTYAFIVLVVFLFTTGLFFFFDWLTRRQQRKVLNTAMRQNALVSSLFPKSIQAKMFSQLDEDGTNKLSQVGKAGIRNYLVEAGGDAAAADAKNIDKSKPIADLFPETTVMFADIAGFTAWSSAREPTQVFILLEAIYHEFDAIAKKRRVFKVEVVGDCYVAVCGLPEPRSDHAVVMAKFSTDCINEMRRLTRELEIELGPDTGELGLRIGLNSGPVVAGVLRGDKSRFQLFGDTMNVASR